MRKNILYILAAFLIATPALASSVDGIGTDALQFNDFPGKMTYYYGVGSPTTFGDRNGNHGSPVSWGPFPSDFIAAGSRLYMLQDSDTDCASGPLDYATCLSHSEVLGCYQTNGSIWGDCVDPPPPPEPSGPFSGIIDIGERAYASTTGESLGASVAWAGDNFTKPFLGSAFALIYYLRWWIVALLIIAACIYFAYRAFRFFRT